MYLSRTLTILLLLFLTVSALHAGAAALKTSEIEGFIASLSELQSLSKKHEDLEKWTANAGARSRGAPGAEVNWMADSIAAIEGHPVYREFEEVVGSHGFESPEHWAEVGDRVLKAFFAATMDQQAPAMKAQMEQAMREIENNTSLTPEQKQIMKETMGSSMAQVSAMSDAPSADVEAVRPYMDRLQRAFAAQ